ncbi:metallophosphoesterase [Bacillus toyonensis]|uniref:metallophosphoesterase n=1 Tax=Bacillus toyonensis TaxID=155322 RepID=UPI002E229D43|nr:metallophosphoesterase [Bacillus toyonensis]MED2737250.1 metallophosphoesterase [Bacillus toyonensis]
MYFVVGDIHGCYEEMKEILKHWNKDKERLVLLGDLIDRGPDSLACVQLAMKLVKEYGAIVLSGNHEELFCEWLNMENDLDFYYMDIFDNTIKALLHSEKNVLIRLSKDEISSRIKILYPEVLEFMGNRPLYYETGKLLFVHAGCNLTPNWKDDAEKDCLWIRSPFIYGKNKTGKHIVFGHTPTSNIHIDKSNKIWESPCGSKTGIDGGCVFGGQLNAIVINDNREILHQYSVSRKS